MRLFEGDKRHRPIPSRSGGEVVMISGGAVSLDVIEFFAERNAGVSEGRNIINVLKKREYIPQ